MGGFGGALKQLSIGFASQAGKTFIHTAGRSSNWKEVWSKTASQEDFTTSMGDSASSIYNYFKNKGGIAFINVMANISKSCDCAGASAPEPKIHDIGILASTDPVALDRACFDLIKNDDSQGVNEWIINSNKLLGENTIEIAEKMGAGTQEYNLIHVEDDNEYDEDEDENFDNIPSINDSSLIYIRYFSLIIYFLLIKF